MRNPGGYAIITDPGCGVTEQDSFTCHHCNRIVFVKPKCSPSDLGGLCKTCMKFICPHCVNKGNCDPWEEQMKRAEASYHARRSYGL